MAKSIKKAIACMLATLMIVCSMPFTAFALVGEEKPDIQLLFNPVYTTGYFDYSEVTSADADMFGYTMLQEAPITYNYKYNEVTGGVSGNLVLEAKKTVPICSSLDIEPLAEDRTLGVGDYFSVTVVMKDCPSIYASQQFIQYSENVEPAGHYTRSASRRTYYGLAGLSDPNFSKVDIGGLKAVDSNSAAGLYPNLDDGAAGNVSEVDTANRVLMSCNTIQDGVSDFITTTVVDPGENTYTDPKTGALGYTFENLTVCNTFIFKIVGEGEIGFQLYDPDNTKVTAYGGAYLISTGANGIGNSEYTTYATVGEQPAKGAGNMTFFGGNINTGVVPTPDEPVEQPHVHNYSAVVTAPTCTEQGYTTYTCDNADGKCNEVTYVSDYVDPTGHTEVIDKAVAATCTTTGLTEGKHCSVCNTVIIAQTETPALGHDMQVVEGSAKAPTCTEAGKEADKACSRCDYTEAGAEIPATGSHSYTVLVSAKQEATCTSTGKEAVYKCETCDLTIGGETIDKLAHTEVVDPAVDPTCTETGLTEGKHCSVCNTVIVAQQVVDALGHDMQVVDGSAKAPTCTEAGKEADKACSRCDYKETGAEIPATGHTEVIDKAVAATCTTTGLTEGKHCSVCGEVLVAQTETPALGHTEGAVVKENVVAATCSKEGSFDEVVYCTVCNEELSRTTKTTPATGTHSYTVLVSDKKDATCVEDGKTAEYKCANCDATKGGVVIPATGVHTPVSANNKVDSTANKDGHEADIICDVCKEVLEKGAVIPATGVNVTIDNTYENLGDVVEFAYGTQNFAYGTEVTLTAKPVDGAKFVGFEIDGKLVVNAALSGKMTYSFTAYKDFTITPVFVADEEDKITVVFYDKYNNIIASYVGVTVSEFQAAMVEALPTPPVYAGYEFTNWDMAVEDIKALNKSATIRAWYDPVETGFEVTGTGFDLVLPSGVTNGAIPFDTKVTVKAAGATRWEIDGAVVGYGDTYDFFVGSDVEITPIFEAAVKAQPTLAMVNTYKISNDSYKVMFLASMHMPEDVTLVDRGFVYGKALTDAELVLENVGNKGSAANAGVVKSMSVAASKVEQFGLSYGIKAMNANASAKAYLQFINEDGDVETIYSQAAIFDYMA